ncbi:hypothetical protein ACET3Z_027881 [Daucus carota]
MHAVVVLYNYYHRKRHPSLEYLTFTSCCKLAVIFKPKLLAYMKLMCRPDYHTVVDLKGIWSAIERDLKSTSEIGKCSGLRPRTEVHTDEDALLQLAFSGINEVAGSANFT